MRIQSLALLASIAIYLAPDSQGAQCPPGPPPPPPPPGNDGGGSGGDAAPPSAGPTSPPPAAPSPGRPVSPAPTSPTSPPPSAPAGGGVPSGAPSGPGAPGAGPIGPTSAVPAGAPTSNPFEENLLHWSHWWYLESSRFLDLRSKVQGPVAENGRSIIMRAPFAPPRAIVEQEVIPTLIEIARTDRADETVAAALVALGRMADTPDDLHRAAVDAVTSHLNSANPRVRESAVLGLGLFATPTCNRVLASLLEGGADGGALVGSTVVPTRVRAFAAYGLGLASVRTDDLAERQHNAIALIEALEGAVSPRPDVPVAALIALGLVELPERALIPAKELRERKVSSHALSARSLAVYLEGWTKATRGDRTDKTTIARSHACVAFARAAAGAGELTRAAAIESLIERGADRTEHMMVRTSADVALGEIARAGDAKPDADARQHLLATMKSGQPLERRFAMMAVASASGRPGAGDDPMAGANAVRQALTTELRSAKSGELAWAALAAGTLEDALHRADIKTNSMVVDALQTLGVKRRGDDASSALGLALAFAARGTDRAAKASTKLVKELKQTTTPDLRSHLHLALGLVDHDAAADVLKADLEEAGGRPVLLWGAAVGLALMDQPVSASLAGRLQSTNSSQERIGIAAALGQVGTSRAVAPLLDILDGPGRSAPLRASAIDALGSMCDRDRFSWRDPIAHALPYFAGTTTLSSDGLGLLERAW